MPYYCSGSGSRRWCACELRSSRSNPQYLRHWSSTTAHPHKDLESCTVLHCNPLQLFACNPRCRNKICDLSTLAFATTKRFKP
jgi:hypothetical protein